MIDQIQEAHAAFEQMLDRIEVLSARGEHELAASAAQHAANRAWLRHCGIFASPRLERALAGLATALRPAASFPRNTEGQRKVALVATRAFPAGGHSRILWRWAQLDRNSRHTIVLTQQQGVAIPEQIGAMQAAGEVDVAMITGDGWLGKAAALRDVLAGHDVVILLTHPDDPLPCIAIPALSPSPPVLTLDHASHTFWLGAGIADKVISMDSHVNEERRGIPAEAIAWIPLPLDLERLAKAPHGNRVRSEHGIPDDATLILSCGSAYKFWPIDGISLASLVAPALARHPGTHLLAVGATASPAWNQLAEQYPGRVHLGGALFESELLACYHAADIYVDSAPFSSPTALIEAAATGLPILSFCLPDWRSSGFLPWLGTVPRSAVTASSTEIYAAFLDRLIADREYRAWRAAFGQAYVRNGHSDTTFANTLEATYAALESDAGKIRLDEGKTAWKCTPLDRQLLDLAANMRAQETSMATAPEVPRLDQWSSSHRFSTDQAAWIQARFDQSSHVGLIVFIRCDMARSDVSANVIRTLDSLSALPSFSRPDLVVVLGDGCDPADSGMAGQAVFFDAQTAESQASAIGTFMQRGDGDWFLIVDAGDEFTSAGLASALLTVIDAPDLRAICTDELMRDDEGNLSALLRPDFNLDLLLSMPSGMARHWLFRREAFLDASGFDPACADAAEFDLLLRLIDAGGIEGFGHVHEPLLITPPQQIASKPSEQESILRHLHHRGYEEARIESTLPGCYRIHYGHRATPGVSIIIPTKNQFRLLLRCIDTLIEKTAYKNYEVLIVDNGSTEEDACTWLDGLEAMGNPQLRVIRYPLPFNYSAMNNLAAQHARGDYLVLLNNDTAILREDWLDAMLNHAQRPEVGAVGAKLLYPDGRIQHAGVVLGLRGPAEHPFIGESPDAPGYMYRLQVDQDYSAVTGACLMVRKSLYEEVGGLDEEAFKVSYNDVDLCLKVRAAGYLVVWTPHAVLLHEGSVSQAREDKAVMEKKALRFLGEQDAFYDKWLPVAAHDPAYNDNLTLNGPAFQVETHPPVAWNPLTWRPLPVAVAFAADQAGCGHYRVIQPAAAMRDFGLATTDVCHRYLSPVEMERASPDTLVLQRQMNESQIGQQQRIARFNGCFKVAELDDYLPKIPRKSAHHGSLPKDILKTMRKSLTLVDRFVVSTPALAEMLDGMHPDIRVVENHLPLHWWADVKGERRTGRKPRVGWGGAAGHRGDLELIADVVEALSDEVEWVFFGMCPDKLKPFVHEIVQPVAIGDYPGRLASLNLDLAIAPLEDNTFNQCKSNLRLLEYGACGFPVVCSDVRPYQCDLPVTRVKPRFKEWTEAIRMHVNDLDAAAKAGDALREAIHRDWMLDEQYARFWLSQWMPD